MGLNSFAKSYCRCLAPLSSRGGLAVIGSALILLSTVPPQPAMAQSDSAQFEEEFGEGLDPFETDGPVMAVISLGSQKIRVWDRNGLVADARVSTGRKGHETPEGIFSVIQRKVEHYSNLYDDAEMPFMQRITWSGVALHEGHVPRYRASHGCIRLPDEFAERLYRTTKIGTRVVIASHDAKPMALSHPQLLQPGTTLPPILAEQAPEPTLAPDEPMERPMMLGAGHPSNLATGALPGKPLPSLADLRRERRETKARLVELTKSLRKSWRKVRPARAGKAQADRALRRAAAAVTRAEKDVYIKERQIWSARDARQEAAAISRHIDALQQLALARGWESEAREAAAQIAGSLLAAQDDIKAMTAERQRLINKSSSLWRRTQPVTVLISRAEGRLYVRRAFHPVIDMPIAIKDAERPIGTHIFTAFESDEDENELAWKGLTLETPEGKAPVASSEGKRAGKSRKSKAKQADEQEQRNPIETARQALDRIAFPREALEKILPSLQPGSTLIVSDLGPSIETGPGTDIVVQTRGEEAAKAFIARFQAKQRRERVADRGDEPRRRSSGRTGNWQRW